MTTSADAAQTKTTKRTRKPAAKKAAEPKEDPAGSVEPAEAVATKYPLMERPADDANLALKLAYIMGEIGTRTAEGSNSHFNYKYFTDKQLSGIFQSRFASMGIIVVPSVLSCELLEGQTSRGGRTILTTLKVLFTVMDGHTGQTVTGTGIGQGDDPGDKGSNKAMTGALKYFLIKLFNIGGEADAEADATTDERATAPQQSQTKRTEQRGPARPEDSKTGEVKRGGRPVTGTELQVNSISKLAAEIGFGMPGMINVLKNVLEIEVQIDPKDKEAGPQLRKFLGSLKADDLGKIVTALEEAKRRSGTTGDQLDRDFAQAEDVVRQAASGEENQDG